jgi:hypothetical protein
MADVYEICAIVLTICVGAVACVKVRVLCENSSCTFNLFDRPVVEEEREKRVHTDETECV